MPSSYFNEEAYPDLFSEPNKDTFFSSPNWAGNDIFEGSGLQPRLRNPNEIAPLPGYDNPEAGQPAVIPGTAAENGLSAGTTAAIGAGVAILNQVTKAIETQKAQPTTRQMSGKVRGKIASKAKKKYGLA
tara:strand:- start:1857 stop:2246 length:390 start_codon:yes stop_codon:yes gene_type:complete